FLHAWGDAISSMGVVLGGVVIVFTGRFVVDAIIGIAIGSVIIVGAVRLIREATHILMEGTPLHLHLDDVKNAMSSVPGVMDVRDLHVWSICSDIHAASAHVVVADMQISDLESITHEIKRALSELHIHHTTLQFVAEART
ncbi:MAG: cation diffusion facilitator family transporter, partial [Candidatus Hydrothermarchaeaceae archaeon]